MAEHPGVTTSSQSRVNVVSNLLVNIEDLVNCRSIERQRLEFKKSWNKGPTMFQIIKTVCAFANDFYNDNGGYIVIGLEEKDEATSEKVTDEEASDEEAGSHLVGQMAFPPVGINPKDVERIQKEILGECKRYIQPPYSPILSPEIINDKHVLVIWAQPSDDRPHKARKSRTEKNYVHFIRKGPETVEANEGEVDGLLRSSNKIPFDDRIAKPLTPGT